MAKITKLPNNLEEQNYLSPTMKNMEMRERTQRIKNLYTYSCSYSIGYKSQVDG
jgi:hypothetical protein